ncbi:MAG TPA: YdcF family protein [Burkholderiales bacterium]|nr:YdcF family protein [Burkholderiales bacterium]
MIRPTLIRKRQVWLPTVWGWLFLAVICFAAALAAARNLHGYLAQNAPVGAPILVVEGWLDPDDGLDDAVALFRSGGYSRVVTTGGPLEQWPGVEQPATFAERAANYLVRKGLSKESVTAVPTPGTNEERTYLSAVTVREWAAQSGVKVQGLDILSSGTHARRSRLLYELAFGPSVKVGVYAARFPDYEPDRWWRTSLGAKDVLVQAIGLLWVKCFFWPSPPPDRVSQR